MHEKEPTPGPSPGLCVTSISLQPCGLFLSFVATLRLSVHCIAAHTTQHVIGGFRQILMLDEK